MATRKDQLDAFNFARRRMVANLVVPTATGSDEGAPRPVKTFASSIILSALAVVAVMVLGVFKPSAPTGWQNGLAIDSSSGAAYITQNNELHAVLNITSARLILGTNFSKYDVPDATLNNSGITIGSPVGILNAPEDVPAAGNMTLSDWSFCQNEILANGVDTHGGQTYLEIGYTPSATTPVWTAKSGAAIIVHDSSNDVYLIDGDYKYKIGNDTTDQGTVQSLLTAINQDRPLTSNVTGFWVSDAWLSAFSPGAPITFPKLSDLGESVSGLQNQPGQQIGEYGPFTAGSELGGAVQTSKGVVTLSPFAYYLYAANQELNENHVSQFTGNQLNQSAINEANSAAGGTPTPTDVFATNSYGVNWPTLSPSIAGLDDTSAPENTNLCVGYSGGTESGVPALTTWLSASLPYGSPNNSFGLSQTGSNAQAGTVLIKPGYGLLAKRTGGGDEYLIEDSGYRYPMLSGVVAVAGATASPSATAAGSTSESSSGSSSCSSNSSGSSGSSSGAQPVSAICQLGYSNVKPEQVPMTWLSLLQGGAALDPAKAGQSPQSGS